jgi:hypothetical protein
MDHDGAPLAALPGRHVPDRRPRAEPTGVLEKDAHADVARFERQGEKGFILRGTLRRDRPLVGEPGVIRRAGETKDLGADIPG